MSDLTLTALALDASHERLGWDLPARLYGIDPGHTWVQVDEGDPYEIVGDFTLLPGEAFVAVALVCEGWGSPPGGRRPRSHPKRKRIRTTVVIARDGSHISVIHLRGGEPEVIEGGEGELMERLLGIWGRVAAIDN